MIHYDPLWFWWLLGEDLSGFTLIYGFQVLSNSPINYDYYSYGHLLVITGYKRDYTSYKWGYKYL